MHEVLAIDHMFVFFFVRLHGTYSDPAQWTAQHVQLFLTWFKDYTSLNSLDPAVFHGIDGPSLMNMSCDQFMALCEDGDIIHSFLQSQY